MHSYGALHGIDIPCKWPYGESTARRCGTIKPLENLRMLWVGRLITGCSHSKHSIAVWKVVNDLCTKFEPNWMKIGRVFEIFGWVAGWAGLRALNWLPDLDSMNIVMTSHRAKFQLDITKHSRVIPW